jgi:hypothetical protein
MVGGENMDSIYRKNGYKNRRDYLESLASDMDIPFELVAASADMLGPSEDFDGLVVMLQDAFI